MLLLLPLAIAGLLLMVAGLFAVEQRPRVRVALVTGGVVLVLLPLILTYVRGG